MSSKQFHRFIASTFQNTHCLCNSPELTLYQRRLEEYSRKPSSTLRSFQSFFKHGASRKESLTLCKMREVIKKHLSHYTAGLNERSDAWQQYGEFNEAIGTFDFCPDKFIQPLKDRMIFQIQFQEMMAHTVRLAVIIYYYLQNDIILTWIVITAIICRIRRRYKRSLRKAKQTLVWTSCQIHCAVGRDTMVQ